MSSALANEFLDPEVVNHTGGHYLPASGLQKEAYQDFFKAMHENADLNS